MGGITTNTVSNANVYLDGNTYIGRAEEAELPKVKPKMLERKGLGLIGSNKYPVGLEEMEAKIKWNSFYPDAAKKMANPFVPVQLQLRSSIETFEAQGRVSQTPLVVTMIGVFTEAPYGTFKQGEQVELESTMLVSYLKVEIGGEEITEIDVETNVWKANGVDLLEQWRANLGA